VRVGFQRNQFVKRRRPLLAVFALALVALVEVSAYTSPQYEQVEFVLQSPRIAEVTGEIRAKLLLFFNIRGGDGRASGMSIYAIGTKSSGLVQASVLNEPYGPRVTSISYKGHRFDLTLEEATGR
jgi:hypothetical protein